MKNTSKKADSSLNPIQFFLSTNMMVWYGSRMYPQTLEGLGTCYAAAIPFFGPTLLGNLLYVTFMFTAHHHLATKFSPDEVVAKSSIPDTH